MTAYILVKQTGKLIGFLNEITPITKELADSLVGKPTDVAMCHAQIVAKEGQYFLIPLDEATIVNGRRVNKVGNEQSILLNHEHVIHLGSIRNGITLVFKNEEQKQRMQDGVQLALSFSSQKSAAEMLNKAFFTNSPTSLDEFAKHILEFMESKFRIQRSAVYQVVNQDRLIPIAARANSQKFAPPRSIMHDVWLTKKPVRFDVQEADDEDISQSIQTGKITSAICIPFLGKKDELIAILYIDTQRNTVKLSPDDLIILCAIVPGIAGALNIFFEQEKNRLHVEKLFCQLSKIEHASKHVVQAYNRNLKTLALVKRFGNNTVLCFVSLLGENKEYSVRTALYITLLTLLEQYLSESRQLDACFELVQNFVMKKFPKFQIALTLAELAKDRSLSVYSAGKSSIVVKNPNRVAYVIKTDVPEISGDMKIIPELAQITSLDVNSFFLISTANSEKTCEVFDRNDEKTLIDYLGKLGEGIYVKIKDNE